MDLNQLHQVAIHALSTPADKRGPMPTMTITPTPPAPTSGLGGGNPSAALRGRAFGVSRSALADLGETKAATTMARTDDALAQRAPGFVPDQNLSTALRGLGEREAQGTLRDNYQSHLATLGMQKQEAALNRDAEDKRLKDTQAFTGAQEDKRLEAEDDRLLQSETFTGAQEDKRLKAEATQREADRAERAQERKDALEEKKREAEYLRQGHDAATAQKQAANDVALTKHFTPESVQAARDAQDMSLLVPSERYVDPEKMAKANESSVAKGVTYQKLADNLELQAQAVEKSLHWYSSGATKDAAKQQADDLRAQAKEYRDGAATILKAALADPVAPKAKPDAETSAATPASGLATLAPQPADQPNGRAWNQPDAAPPAPATSALATLAPAPAAPAAPAQRANPLPALEQQSAYLPATVAAVKARREQLTPTERQTYAGLLQRIKAGQMVPGDMELLTGLTAK